MMLHTLYRPHIHFPDKVVTPDFLITDITLKHAKDTVSAQPDQISYISSLIVDREHTIVFKAVAVIAGQDSNYYAPAIVRVSKPLSSVNFQDALKWARICIVRQAVISGSNTLELEGTTLPQFNGMKRGHILVEMLKDPCLELPARLDIVLSGDTEISATFNLLPDTSAGGLGR